MEATYLINNIKERICYVPPDFEAEMKKCSVYVLQLSSSHPFNRRGRANKIKAQYVLPDYITSTLGYVKGVDPLPEMPAHMMGQTRPEEQVCMQ